MQPVLAELIEKRGIVVLYILKILEGEIIVFFQIVVLIVFVLRTRGNNIGGDGVLNSLHLAALHVKYRHIGRVEQLVTFYDIHHGNSVYDAVVGHGESLSAVVGYAAHLDKRREQVDKRCGLRARFALVEKSAVFVPTEHERDLLSALVGKIFAAPQSAGGAFERGAVVARENNYRVFQLALRFKLPEKLAEVVVELRYAVDICTHSALALEFVADKNGRVRPRGGVVREKRLIRVFGLFFYPRGNLLMNPLCGVRLIFKLVRAVLYRILAADLADMVKRLHVVYMVAAVEVVEALIRRQIFTVVAEVPFAEAAGGVPGGFEYLREGYLVAEHTVRIIEHFDTVKNTRLRKRREAVDRGVNHIVGIPSVRISARERGKTRRRTDGIARIKIGEIQSVFAYRINVRSVIYRAV